jgi:hypothetical protein
MRPQRAAALIARPLNASVRHHMGAIAKYPRAAVVVAGATGLVVGGYTAFWFGGRMLTSSVSSMVQARVTWDALVLARLAHADAADAAKLLNANMDSELYLLAKFHESGTPLLPGMQKTLQRIAESRADTHYEYSDDDARASIQRLLATPRREAK